MDRQHARTAGLLHLVVDLGCDAMAQHVPPGGVAAGELQAFLAAESAPDALGVRAQLVDDDRRIGVAGNQFRAVRRDQSTQRVESELSEIDSGGRELGILDAPEVGLRQPAVA